MVFDDGIDSVRDGENCARMELFGNDFLHVVIRLRVHARGRLIEAYYLRISQHCPRQAQHLTLPGRVV